MQTSSLNERLNLLCTQGQWPQAISLLSANPKVNSPVYSSTYACLIQYCIDSNCIEKGQIVQAHMISNDFEPDTFLQTKLIMLQARCGNVAFARRLFDNMTKPNSTAWNTMLIGYSKAGHDNEVLELFSKMHRAGCLPDRFGFPATIKGFSGLEDETGIKLAHALTIKTSLSENFAVGSGLVDGYAKVGLMGDASLAFEEIGEKSLVSWNALIGGYVRAGRPDEAWEAFSEMQALGMDPDHFTLASMIKACGALKSVLRGEQVHGRVLVSGFGRDVFVSNSLIDMYAKLGSLEACLHVFDSMPERNQVSWNTLISAHAQLGWFEQAFYLFARMQQSGFESDRFNMGSILMACAGLAAKKPGREIHSYLIRGLLELDVVLGSALVDMYSKCGSLEEARRVFDRMGQRNVVSWNAIIVGFVQVGQGEEALNLYHQMKQTGTVPDEFTFASLLTLYTDEGNLNQGKEIHAHIIRTSAQHHLILETALVDFYAKCKRLKQAYIVFDRMPKKNAYSWNALIVAYQQHGHPEEALNLLLSMQLAKIKPDCFSLNSILYACMDLFYLKRGKQVHGFLVRNLLEDHGILRCTLVDMYSTCGRIDDACRFYHSVVGKDVYLHNVMIASYVNCNRIEEARQIFDEMGERNSVSWNAMLSGYTSIQSEVEALRLFSRMMEGGVEYDSSTLVTLFDACAGLAALEQGKLLHACMIKQGFMEGVVLDSALLDMYAKCGDIEAAKKKFHRMVERNTISWNAMITGYAKHGQGRDALILFDQMQHNGIHLNHITFLSILSACSHTGLIDEGLKIFLTMIEEHGITPRIEHYNCMVDLLSRAGHLEDAYEIIRTMPLEPDVSTWGALLGACRVHGNVSLGRHVAGQLFELDPKNPGNYVLLANIFASKGRWKEADEVRKLMKSRGVTKDPGFSWIEIDKEVHMFRAGDSSHFRYKEIRTTLECLLPGMKEMGYIPDTSYVLHDVKEEEKLGFLLRCSERLAIALLRTTIMVFKKLPIHEHCHSAKEGSKPLQSL
ncbi:LOW QUALITY PROTEIN: pentatricopeptide repeat-containing protein At3g24000, mitochondrial [Amborella trichopoda]|uniref:LOW QUALITY PROTEIN: pentatricopeptide repeat-containing protein At3g24000, mitochondrial n=1 Tax=Amborella trichopoda TaxID=13333 RepID=UPI0009BDBC7B|nr:LOW QUALITY PROTEIN: pentatricopeptide repeat-containing protein At3g24000, mitochondrial [Amborella trichopoda]|eukprot:XP_011628278.2 LOW QUALITY PROTEIN: pentatricopeptide repeat-containing protein At3g24000, mitochondrial [Amborella trichopoda]